MATLLAVSTKLAPLCTLRCKLKGVFVVVQVMPCFQCMLMQDERTLMTEAFRKQHTTYLNLMTWGTMAKTIRSPAIHDNNADTSDGLTAFRVCVALARQPCVLLFAGSCALGPDDTASPCSDEAARHVGHALGRNAASHLLQPLFNALCERLLAILKRMPALTLAEYQLHHQSLGSASISLPERLCDNFLAVVQGQAVVLVDALKVCLLWCSVLPCEQGSEQSDLAKKDQIVLQAACRQQQQEFREPNV
jgi:hypothetical protein